MIYYISGTLKEKLPTNVIIESQGIGIELRIPISTYEKLPGINQNCFLFTYLYLSFNQDEIRLYGFSSLAEKAVFGRLIAISGIGPKIALSIISSLSLPMFFKAVQSSEDGLLSKVPGIGKKTAQRIIIELKDDVLKLADLLEVTDKEGWDDSFNEVEKALTALGYSAKDVRRSLPLLSDDEKQLPVEQIIKKIIKIIYQKN
jgi:holliday junction DNA helicase RuvA